MNIENLFISLGETILMTVISTFLAYLIGLPLGIILYITGKKGLVKNKAINQTLGIIINLLRSIPCLLLIIILLPLTRAILGKGTGEWYVIIIPLFFASFPFVSRMVEQSLLEIDEGVVEASRAMGGSTFKIIIYSILPECKVSLITGVALSMVSILGYTSFAYNIGAGGLISEAYSLYRQDPSSPWAIGIWVIILVIVILVQVIQEGTLLISRKIDKRRIIKWKK